LIRRGFHQATFFITKNSGSSVSACISSGRHGLPIYCMVVNNLLFQNCPGSVSQRR
jgi:hypothetical protein